MTIEVILKDYELNALIEWHRNQMYETARDEDYISAHDHKKRVEELLSIQRCQPLRTSSP